MTLELNEYYIQNELVHDSEVMLPTRYSIYRTVFFYRDEGL